jgi:hypothetical protein
MSRRAWMMAAVVVTGSVWIAGCGGGGVAMTGTSPSGTTAPGGNPSITVSKKPKPAPKPKPTKPKPAPKPEPVNTENQACSGYSGVDENACHDSYEYACVDGQVQQNVRDYYEGNAPDLATQAQRWALSYYTRAGSWMAGMAGCLAALMDEYHRRYG